MGCIKWGEQGDVAGMVFPIMLGRQCETRLLVRNMECIWIWRVTGCKVWMGCPLQSLGCEEDKGVIPQWDAASYAPRYRWYGEGCR